MVYVYNCRYFNKTGNQIGLRFDGRTNMFRPLMIMITVYKQLTITFNEEYRVPFKRRLQSSLLWQTQWYRGTDML